MKTRKTYLKTCVICGREFESKSHQAKYCGKFCAKCGTAEAARKRYEAKKPAVTYYCKRCGEALPEGSASTRMYCATCRRTVDRERQQAYKAKRKEEKASRIEGHHKRVLHTFRCEMCGEEAKSYGRAKYCEACKERKKRNTHAEYIGKREGRTVYHKKCDVCRLPFSTLMEEHERCPVCKKEDGRTRKEKKPVLSIEEQMRIIEAYNREHGTNLSYGRYMAMMRTKGGEARVDVKL